MAWNWLRGGLMRAKSQSSSLGASAAGPAYSPVGAQTAILSQGHALEGHEHEAPTGLLDGWEPTPFTRSTLGFRVSGTIITAIPTVAGIAKYIYDGVQGDDPTEIIMTQSLSALGMFGLFIYFTCAMIPTVRARKQLKAGPQLTEPVVSERYRRFMALLYALTVSFHPVIFVGGWAFYIHQKFWMAFHFSLLESLIMFYIHGVNVLLVFGEIYLSDAVLDRRLWWVVLLASLIYPIYAVIGFVLVGHFIYPNINMLGWGGRFIVFGIVVACTLIAFRCMCWLHRYRDHRRQLRIPAAAPQSSSLPC